MGDTFDDWLVDKIQLLRKGRIIAFAVKRVEQVSLRLYLKQKKKKVQTTNSLQREKYYGAVRQSH